MWLRVGGGVRFEAIMAVKMYNMAYYTVTQFRNYFIEENGFSADITGSFYQQTGLKSEEETSEVLRLEHSSVWC